MGQTVIKPPVPEQRATGTRPRRWTREEYYRAAECGVFKPGERLELLDGEILQKMSPQRPPHATGLTLTAHALGRAFGPDYYVRQQLPLVLNDQSEPEPDLVVVPGTPLDYLAHHPTAADARLVVEIADTTLRLDRKNKQRAYARSGIPEYWIENLPQRQLEVYRDPSGQRYRSITFYNEQETIVPLDAPQSPVRVADLLPPPTPKPDDGSINGEEAADMP
jgi:Uma2 family endonuclease